MDFGSLIGSSIGATASHISDAVNYISNKQNNRANRQIAEQTNIASANIANANNVFQREQNELNNQFSHDEAALAFERQKELLRLEQDWNSPAAMMQRYVNAGINPFVAMSGQTAFGSSAPSVQAASPHGSGVSSSMPSLVAATQQPYFMKSVGVTESAMQMAQAFDFLASAQKKGVETSQLQKTFDKYMLSLDLQNILTEESGRLMKAFGSEKATAEIVEKYAHAFQLYQAGDELGAKKALDESETAVNKELARFHGAKADEAREMANHVKERINAEIDSMRANAYKSRAEGNQANANAKTINELRDGLVKIQYEELKTSQYARRSAALDMLNAFEEYQNTHLTPEQRKLFVAHVTEKLKNQVTEEEWKRIVTSNPTVGVLSGFLNSVGSAVLGSAVKLAKP